MTDRGALSATRPLDEASDGAEGVVLPFQVHSESRLTSGWPLGVVLVAGDLAGLACAWLVTGVALHRWWGQTWSGAALGTAAMVVVGVVLLRGSGLHRARICAVRSVELAKLGRVAACSAAAAYLVGLVPRDHAGAAAAGGVITFVSLAVERALYRAWVRGLRRRGHALRRVLVLGSSTDTEVIVPLISDSPELGYEVSGIIRLPALANASTLGAGSGLAGRVLDAARALDVTGLVIATGAVPPAETAQLVRCALTMGLHVQVWGGLPGIDQRRLQPLPLGHQPGFYLAPPRVSDWQRIVKRLVDLTLAPLVLFMTAPLIVLVAALIKLGDGGPIVFRQRRIGRDGREFTLYKFRSTVVDAFH